MIRLIEAFPALNKTSKDSENLIALKQAYKELDIIGVFDQEIVDQGVKDDRDVWNVIE